MRVRRMILTCILITLSTITNVYGAPQTAQPESFRDVPGVTDSEIKAIQSFIARDAEFTVGVPFSAEAFPDTNGKVNGFASLFCGWLTDLFGIPFTPVICTDTLAALDDGQVDFALTTDSGQKDYNMTGSVIDRPVKMFTIAGSEPLADIASARPVRLAFVTGSTEANAIMSSFEYDCETVTLPSIDATYEALKTGEADAFFSDGSAVASFETHYDIIAADYLPLVLSSEYLAAKSSAYAPIISIAQKALLTGGGSYLIGLYNDGYQDYLKHRLIAELTDIERAYIQTHSVVPFVAQYYNYPISFYNSADKQWQGIVIDLLAEVTRLTGITFQVINAPDAEFTDLNRMLLNGDAAFITRLVRTKDREGRYLWSETSVMDDKYVLISKSDFPNISLNDILNVNVGLVADTAQANLFRSWFPNNVKTVEYSGLDAAISALDRGEMDLVMASYSQLLYLTNYLGKSGYKANFVFDSALDANLGFNINEADLRSIIDKAARLIDISAISERWSYKTFTSQAQPFDIPILWMICGAAVIVLGGFAFVVWRKKSGKRRKETRQTGASGSSNKNGHKHALIDRIISKKLYNFLFLLPVAIMIAFSLFFSSLLAAIQQNLLEEKFAEKKLEVSIMANNTDEFIRQDDDWESQHEYYKQSLVFNMEELDRSYMTFAVVYDKNLTRLSKQVNYNGGFDPMAYPSFVTEVMNNQTMGDVIIDFKPTDGAEREVYVHYRWIPTGTNYDDRFLVVVAISKLTIVTQTDGWFTAGAIALIVITTLLNIAMVAIICKMASRK